MNGGAVEIQSVDARLREIDQVILRHEKRRDELINGGGNSEQIDVERNFLEVLYGRRDTILRVLEAERRSRQSGRCADTGGLR